VEAVCLGLLLVMVALTVWRYPQLPPSIPTHWNIAGQADGWVPRNLLFVSFPVTMMALMQGFWVWLLVGIARVPVQLPAERREEYRAARERYMAVWVTWTNLGQLAMQVMFAGIVWASFFGIERQARGAMPPGMIVLWVSGGALMLSLPWLVVQVTRRRAAMRAIVGPGSIEHAAPTEGWIAGVFYYNKDDPSVWVEKRVGIGWTLNMARPASWVFLAVILGLPIAFTVAMLIAAPK
jgi:uncharacterized membrane protein